MPSVKSKAPIDVSRLSVTDDPYPARRPTAPRSKYFDFFQTVKQGQRIVVDTGQANKVSGALMKHLKQQGYADPVVRFYENAGDGQGGVWWLDDSMGSPQHRERNGFPWPNKNRQGAIVHKLTQPGEDEALDREAVQRKSEKKGKKRA